MHVNLELRPFARDSATIVLFQSSFRCVQSCNLIVITVAGALAVPGHYYF